MPTPKIAAEVAEYGVHGDLAGEFAGGLSPHAITDDEDPMPHVKAEIILVVGTHQTNISLASGLDHQIHSTPVQALNPILVRFRRKYCHNHRQILLRELRRLEPKRNAFFLHYIEEIQADME